MPGSAGYNATATPAKTDLPGEALLRNVGRFVSDEVGRRNRLFLEALSREVSPCRPPSPLLEEFYREDVLPYLDSERPSWGWLFTPAAREPITRNRARAIQVALGPSQARVVQQLMQWVERRRQVNIEDWLDRLANCWLPVHGWVAVVLLILMVDHVVGSIWFGGN